ncbi:MAG: hypothetical protein ACWA42_05765, partial [Lutibacter sp.]
ELNVFFISNLSVKVIIFLSISNKNKTLKMEAYPIKYPNKPKASEPYNLAIISDPKKDII